MRIDHRAVLVGPAAVAAVLTACASLPASIADAPSISTLPSSARAVAAALPGARPLPLPPLPTSAARDLGAARDISPLVYHGAHSNRAESAILVPLRPPLPAVAAPRSQLTAADAGWVAAPLQLTVAGDGVVTPAAAPRRVATPGTGAPAAVTRRTSPPAAVTPRTPASAAAGAGLGIAPPSSLPPGIDGTNPLPRATGRAAVAVAAPPPQARPATGARDQPTTELASARTPELAPDDRAFARVGDGIELALPGAGWIYLGDLQGRASGVAYDGRSIDADSTLFSFRASRIGDYLLEFQLQDHRTGGEQRQTVLVSVVAPLEFDRILANGGIVGPASSQPRDTLTAAADQLFAEELHQQALDAYLAAEAGLAGGVARASSSAAHVNGRIAELQFRAGDFQSAARYWQRNVELSGDALGATVADARIGLVRVALAREDVVLLEPLIGYLLQLPAVDRGQVQRDATRLLQDNGRWEISLRLLRDYLHRYPVGPHVAEVQFRLAALYETNWRGRDLRRARAQYLQVNQQFPASEFALPARERIRYLDRHYFVVN